MNDTYGYCVRRKKWAEISEAERTYTINGLKYTFTSVHNIGEDTYGYCVRRKKWAEIHKNYICFEGENPVKVDFW